MDKKSIIVVTGAAGFIGSCMVQFLNENGYENLIIVDDFGVEEKRTNWEAKKFINAVERHIIFNTIMPNIFTVFNIQFFVNGIVKFCCVCSCP